MNKHPRYVVLILAGLAVLSMIFGLFACRSTKESQQEKDYKASLAHAKLLEETRALFPCDTSHIVVTKTDTAYVFVSDTTYHNDTAFVTKTKTVTNTVYRTATVVDSAYGKLWQDRYDQSGYLLQNAKDQSDKIAADNTKKDKTIQEQDKTISKQRKRLWIFALCGLGLFLIDVVRLYLKLKP